MCKARFPNYYVHSVIPALVLKPQFSSHLLSKIYTKIHILTGLSNKQTRDTAFFVLDGSCFVLIYAGTVILFFTW